MSGVDDLRLHVDGTPGEIGDDVEFIDVEAPFVESLDASGDSPSVIDVERFPRRQFVPQLVIPVKDLVGGRDDVDALVESAGGLEIQQFPGNVDAGDV